MDYSNLKKNLRELAEKKRKAKEEEDKIRAAKNEEDRNTMLASMSKDFGNVFKPYLEQIKEHSSLTSKELSRLIAESVQINVPGLDTSSLENAVKSSIAEAMGSLRFPTPQSTVNIPEIKIPPVNMPKEMDIKGWIGMMGYDKGLLQNPFPVQIRDSNGKPVDLASIGGQVLTGGGGKMDFFTVKGITNTIGVVTINPDGSPVYNGSSSGLTDTELRASAVPVEQVSGSNWSVAVKEIFGSSITSLLNGDNRIPVSVETGSSGLTDTELRASALQIIQLSGTEFSTVVNSFLTSLETKQVSGVVDSSSVILAGSGVPWKDDTFYGDDVTTGIPAVALRVFDGTDYDRLRGDATNGLRVSNSQVSGAIDSVNVVGFSSSVAAVPTNAAGLSADIPSGTYGNGQLMFRPHDAGAFSDTYANNPQSYVDENYNQILQGVFPFMFNGTTWDRIRGNSTDGLRASVSQVSGVSFSVNVIGPIAQGDEATALRTVQAGNSISSVYITGASGTIAAANVDSSGVQYSGSNPMPTYLVAGSGNSTISVGPVLHDAVDDGAAPQKIGGTAMQANPTPVAGGDIVRATFDDLGRQLIRPIQVRDLVKTAYVSVTNGTETTLRAAVAGAYLDCIMITGSNNSDAAVSVDIRAVTGGNIIHTLRIPANSTAGWTPHIPWPQDETGNNWTVDGPDETGRTLTFSALFSQEV